MAFRRIIFTGENIKDVKDDVERLFDSHKFQQDYADVKTTVKPGVKTDVLVVDLNGDGADSVSRKLKDIGNKFKVATKIRNEIKLAPVKEGERTINSVGQLASDEDIESIKNKLENLQKQYPNWKFNVRPLNGEIYFQNSISYSSNNTSDKEAKEVINKIRTTFIKEVTNEETQSKPGQLKGGFTFSSLAAGDVVRWKDRNYTVQQVGLNIVYLKNGNQIITVSKIKDLTPVSVKSLKEEIQNNELDFIKTNFPKSTIEGPKYANKEGQYVLNILGSTDRDPKQIIIFKPEGGKFLVQCIQGYGLRADKAAAFGLVYPSRTGYAGVDRYLKDGNYNPVVMDKQRFLGLCHLINDGFSSEAKSQGDFYRNRGNTSGTIDEGKIKVSELKQLIKEELNNFIKENKGGWENTNIYRKIDGKEFKVYDFKNYGSYQEIFAKSKDGEEVNPTLSSLQLRNSFQKEFSTNPIK